MRLIIKIAGAIQNTRFNGAINVFTLRKQLNVFWNATCDRIHFNQFFAAFLWEELMIVCKGDLLQPNLGGPSAIKGTVISQCLRLHHGNQRAAENDHNLSIF